MPGFVGRRIVLTWGGQEIEGVQQKGIALSGTPVDVTSDDNDGWRSVLAEPGQNEVTLSLSGVTKSQVLKEDWFAGERTKAVAITYPDGGQIAGQFYLSTYTDNGPFAAGTTFDCELMSTGVVTYTPPTA